MQERAREVSARYQSLADSLRSTGTDMPTLNEHNRGTPPGDGARSGKPAGVRCPMCLLLFGESVQMCIGGSLRPMLWQDGQVGASDQSVRCPRCDHLGIKIG